MEETWTGGEWAGLVPGAPREEEMEGGMRESLHEEVNEDKKYNMKRKPHDGGQLTSCSPDFADRNNDVIRHPGINASPKMIPR